MKKVAIADMSDLHTQSAFDCLHMTFTNNQCPTVILLHSEDEEEECEEWLSYLGKCILVMTWFVFTRLVCVY